MRPRIILILILFLFITKTYAQQSPGTILTLQQAVEAAMKNELTIRQVQTDMETSQIALKQAKGNLLPDLIGNINHGMQQGRSIDPFTNSYVNQQINFASYNLNSSVTLFNGFQLLNTVRQQRYAYNAAQMELQMVKDNITMQVILAYLQILNAEDQVKLAEVQAGLSRNQVERLEILHKDGAIVPSLLYDLKGQLASDEVSMVNAKNNLDQARLNLSQLMNVPFDKNLQVERLTADQISLVYDADAETVYNAALGQLAIVKAADFRQQSANMAVRAARGGYSPSLFLSGNFNTNYSSAARTETLVNVVDVSTNDYVVVGGNKVSVISPQANFSSSKISYGSQLRNNYSTSVALGLRIPIVNGLFARNQVALAKINLKQANFIAQTTRTQLRQNIDQAYFNMKGAQERYRVLQEQVNAFAESFRIAEVRFNAGLGTSVDYLVARINLDRANLNLVNARYDYVLRTKLLDYYQSKPLW